MLQYTLGVLFLFSPSILGLLVLFIALRYAQGRFWPLVGFILSVIAHLVNYFLLMFVAALGSGGRGEALAAPPKYLISGLILSAFLMMFVSTKTRRPPRSERLRWR